MNKEEDLKKNKVVETHQQPEHRIITVTIPGGSVPLHETIALSYWAWQKGRHWGYCR